MRPSKRQVKAFLEFIEIAERYKPFQVAKRKVYSKYGLLGTRFDRITTSIVYKMYRLQGLLDRAIEERLGLRLARLPAFLRQSLRIAAYLALYDEAGDREFADTIVYVAARVAARRFTPHDAEAIIRLYRSLLSEPWTPKDKEEARLLLPRLLVDRIRILLGNEVEEFAKAVNDPRPVLGLRVNTLKASMDEVLDALAAEGVKAEPSRRIPGHIRYRGRLDYERFAPLREGKVVPQDEASAAAGFLLSPHPGSIVADLCAAPGGKTTHLAEIMRLDGIVAAVELYPDRVVHLRSLAARTSTLPAVQPIQGDARFASRLLTPGRFDYILLDPPCTSTGAIAKHPEARWRLSRESIEKHVRLQRALLEEAVKLLKPGGRLLYTVCSVLPEEGEENVRWLLGRFPGLRLVPLSGPYDPSPLLPGAMRAWPHRHGTTGFFYALLEKKQ